MKPFPDFEPVSEFLRQMAPAQTHENRRNFLAAANAMLAVKLKPSEQGIDACVLYDIPVHWDDILIGYAKFTVGIDIDGPYVRSGFEEIFGPDSEEYKTHVLKHKEPVMGCFWCVNIEELEPRQLPQKTGDGQ